MNLHVWSFVTRALAPRHTQVRETSVPDLFPRNPAPLPSTTHDNSVVSREGEGNNMTPTDGVIDLYKIRSAGF